MMLEKQDTTFRQKIRNYLKIFIFYMVLPEVYVFSEVDG